MVTSHVIHNSLHQSINIDYYFSHDAEGVVVIMHGVGGNKDQDIIIGIKNTVITMGYSCILFTTTNTLSSKSAGDYHNATTSNYIHDLDCVMNWIGETIPESKKKIFLGGHCIGGTATMYYCSMNQDKITGLFLISPMISQSILKEVAGNDVIKKREAEGGSRFLLADDETSKHLPTLGINFLTDLEQYNLLKIAPFIGVSTLLISGEKDTLIPLQYHHKLFSLFTGTNKKYVVITGGSHHFHEEDFRIQLYNAIKSWIQGLSN